MSFELRVALFGVVAIIVAIVLSSSPNKQSATSLLSAPPTIGNDADLLVLRCGTPDVDDSTQNDNPRPAIPSRFITYNKAHLKFAYIPGGEKARVFDPPPYKWKFIGLIDTETNSAVTADTLESVLRNRLACALTTNEKENAAQRRENERTALAAKVAQQLKLAMRDPDSFKLTSVEIVDKSEAICYEYRARNGFGGMSAGKSVLSATGKFKSDEMAGFAPLWNKECAHKQYFEEANAVNFMLEHSLVSSR